MFKRQFGDHNPRRFWSWFASEAQGLSNAIEALARGEAEAEWALIGLNERLHRYDPTLEADVIRDLDGRCRMAITGETETSIEVLLTTAPAIRNWTFVSGRPAADVKRVPYRAAPRPSADSSPISARYEAYAV